MTEIDHDALADKNARVPRSTRSSREGSLSVTRRYRVERVQVAFVEVTVPDTLDALVKANLKTADLAPEDWMTNILTVTYQGTP